MIIAEAHWEPIVGRGQYAGNAGVRCGTTSISIAQYETDAKPTPFTAEFSPFQLVRNEPGLKTSWEWPLRRSTAQEKFQSRRTKDTRQSWEKEISFKFHEANAECNFCSRPACRQESVPKTKNLGKYQRANTRTSKIQPRRNRVLPHSLLKTSQTLFKTVVLSAHKEKI